MLAGLYRAAQHRRSRALLALLLVVSGSTLAADVPEEPVRARFAELGEIIRVTPQRAVPLLAGLDAQARRTPAEYARLLTLSCDLSHRLGKHVEAVQLCEQALQLGRQVHDDSLVARALLSKAYALFGLNEMSQSHQLVWEAERLAAASTDVDLRILVQISSGESFAEEGNFPVALTKMQGAVTLARQSGNKLQIAVALKSLAYLYNQMREFDKGFEAIGEAEQLAEAIDSPGRLAIFKTTEYILAANSGDMGRGTTALLSALALERRIGADAMIANTLVNLADSYLKQQDWRRALAYAQQALEQAQKLHDDALAATARVNVGQAYLGMGRLAEGKKHIEQGMDWYQRSGNKPDQQSVLVEYGDALERAGDLPGALAAYHRERALSNELFETRRQKAMMELQEKYEADKRQRQIEMLRQENQVKSTEIDNRRLQQRIWWLLALVFALASVIVGILYRKVRHANAQLEVKNHELKQQSARDPLTALYNRRHFQEFMRSHQDIGRQGAGTSGEDMVSAMFLLDVDHFKHINDTYGHGAGDAVLREIAEALREILRETDMIVRWGGEEFLAFLPAVPRNSLDEVARRLLAGIPARTIDYQGTRLSVNVSIGFAPFPLVPGTPISWERAINIVDMALYLAKGHGRNRAYGVRGVSGLDPAALDEVENDIEKAWRAGLVDLAIVTGHVPELRMAS
ncbi:diguanylate cyclase [Massilia sp. Root133]|uniref:tetratricopeptide repeat-containing diguanylate cyclase n=1 Tax=unclassified Massilia TaxID=2609279 RepID=UPI000700BA7E|nr:MULTISPECIES: tetratricopeptide repeat-containing diguanylate cyclase [unclassified Massilia]KQY05765.1 diguanylate cyclase [Massilia sp. Root133]KQZ52218.1 diguanylate cyclase [Massilia sp. Root1485]